MSTRDGKPHKPVDGSRPTNIAADASEIWALRMLGDEVYRTADTCGYDSGKECRGTAWQRLHLGGT